MNFFVLRSPKSEAPVAVTDMLKAEPIRRGEASKCKRCGKFTSMLKWLPPHHAELELWGDAFGDIAFASGVSILVSDRFVELFKKAGLTGLSGYFPVNITKVKRRYKRTRKLVCPEYFCVYIARSRAMIDDVASGIDYEEPWTCLECKSGFIKRYKRVVLESDTWSGEDIFVARGLGGVIITSERFKDFFEKNKINNGILIPADEYSYDFYPGKK